MRGRWIADDKDEQEEDALHVAVSVQIADRFGVDVNDSLTVGRDESTHQLRVVGIVDNPPVPITGRMSASMTLPSPSIAGIYVGMDDAATILNREPVVTFVGVCLKEGVDVHAFRYAWGPRLSAFERPAQFQEDHDLEEQLDEAAAAKNLKLQAGAATLMAMLLAFLVMFNTLNMGVSERTRQFAMLRAVALTRGQVAAIVFVESLMIAAAGFLGGLVCGQALPGIGESPFKVGIAARGTSRCSRDYPCSGRIIWGGTACCLPVCMASHACTSPGRHDSSASEYPRQHQAMLDTCTGGARPDCCSAAAHFRIPAIVGR